MSRTERSRADLVLERHGSLVLAMALLLVTAAVYAPTLGFSFVDWDDGYHVTSNAALLGNATGREWLLTPLLGYPAPVTLLTYAVEHALFGFRPAVFHADNVLIHLASVILVMRLARKVGLGAYSSIAAAALFALHPTAAEPVSWISGRKDLQAVFFSLATVVGFLGDPFDPRRPRSWLPVVWVLLGAFSKPTTLFVGALRVAAAAARSRWSFGGEASDPLLLRLPR